jgi:hypothetical protein
MIKFEEALKDRIHVMKLVKYKGHYEIKAFELSCGLTIVLVCICELLSNMVHVHEESLSYSINLTI